MKCGVKITIAIAAVLIACRAVGSPTVDSELAASVSTESALVGGTLTAGSSADAFICWGRADFGVSGTGDWQNVESVGLVNQGVAFATTVSNLSTNASYWFRCYVTNAVGTNWSDTATHFSGRSTGIIRTPVSDPHFEWDAAQDFGGDNSWTSTTVNTYTWYFDGGSASPALVSDDRFDALTYAYEFTAARDEANASWGLYDEDPDATFEFVFDTDNANGLIFEAGGEGRGIKFSLKNNSLYGIVTTEVEGVDPVSLSCNIESTERFIHAVFVVDADDDEFELYVDGELKDSQEWPGAAWAGGNDAGLGGTASDTPGIAADPVSDFRGKMAAFRYYRGKAFTGEEITTNFNALSMADPLRNLAPTGVSSNSAEFNAKLRYPDSMNTVYVYWDIADKGTNLTWTYSKKLGTWFNVDTTNISYQAPLSGGTEYYYTFRAETDDGDIWSSKSWRLTTLPGDRRVLYNLSAASITNESATLSTVLYAPDRNYDVYVHWNTTDGIEDINAWTNSVLVGAWTNTAGPTNINYLRDGLTTNTQYYYRFRATNDDENIWGEPTISFITTAPTNPPVIVSLSPASVMNNSADINGSLISTGDVPTTVWAFWGDNNAGTGSWDNSTDFGVNSAAAPVAYSTNITGLIDGTMYYYRYYATNIFGESWGLVESFTTESAPTVTNTGGAISVSPGSADLQGSLTAGAKAEAWICWGITDAGTSSTGDWYGVESVGTVTQDVSFSSLLSNLITNQTYYYRCYVTNSVGDAWSGSATTFSGTPGSDSDSGSGSYRVVGLSFQSHNKRLVDSNDVAGATVLHTNWNNSANLKVGTTAGIAGPVPGKLVDSTGGETGLEISWNCDGGTWYTTTNEVSADEALMCGYIFVVNEDTTVSVTNIATLDFHVYAYFGAAMDGRTGAIGIDGAETYSYTTYSDDKVFPDDYQLTTDTGLGYPNANYAVWSNLTGTGFTLRQIRGSDNSGIHGLQVVIPDKVQNYAPTGIASNYATLNGAFSSSESTNTVYVYWDTTDKGTNLNWAYSTQIGTFVDVESTNVSYQALLSGGTEYYYTFRVENAAGDMWASPSWRFTTPSGDKLVLHNMSAANITNESATLSTVLDAPDTNYNVYVHWNTTDGIEDIGAWTNSVLVGAWTNTAGPTNINYLRDGLTTNTQYYYRFRATNDNENIWGTPTISFITTAPTNPPVIVSLSPASVWTNSADMNGSLISTGDAPTTVWAFWGDDNAGMGSWDNSTNLGLNSAATPVAYSTNITGLSEGTAYYYRYYATNAFGESWGRVETFTTKAFPVVDNAGGAASISADSVLLAGNLSSGVVAQAWICWGSTDGGASSTGDWDKVESVGTVTQNVSFSSLLSNLTTNRTYFYRCYVTNSVGEAWSGSDTMFSGTPANDGASNIVVGVNFRYNWEQLVDTNETAGVTVSQEYWNNSGDAAVGTTASIGKPVSGKLVDGTGSETALTITWDYNGTYKTDNTGNPDEEMMYGYVDNSSGEATVTISNIASSSFDVYAYFGSDVNGRTGTIGIDGADTYSFSTYSGGLSFPGAYQRTTDTGTGYPDANYAVWSGITAKEFTLRQTRVSGNSGLHGLQIVMRDDGGINIKNQPATGITSNSATLNGQLNSIGATNNVYVHYGAIDKGTNMSWSESVLLGSWTNVLETNLNYNASLEPGTTYYYAFMATNDSGNLWASPSWQFITPGVQAATINHAVPHFWLETQNSNWTNDFEAAATSDHDGDGYSTWEEYWSGTDPQSSNSFLKIDSVWYDGTNFVLKWRHANVDASIPPIAVQRSFDLSTGTWSYVGQKIPQDGTNTWLGAPISNAFFRIAATNTP